MTRRKTPTPGVHERPDQRWRARAECRGSDPGLFHSDDDGDPKHAKAICARCPVVEPCLALALDDPALYGVWGGTSEAERRDLRQQRRRSCNRTAK